MEQNTTTGSGASREPVERLYSTAEVALLLGKCKASVLRYGKMGLLVPVKGNKCVIGWTGKSVRALLNGEAN